MANPGMETAVKIPNVQARAPKGVDARAFAAGTGVTGALVAAAILAFASIAVYVAFEGMPFSSGDTPESTVSLSGAPQAAALTAGQTADAVAADPATPSAAAIAEILAAAPGATGAPAPGAGSSGPGDDRVVGGGNPPRPGPGPAAPGPLEETVGSVDGTTGGLGLDLPLESTDPITQQVDDAVGGALNNVSNAVGGGSLADKVNGTVGGLLGD